MSFGELMAFNALMALFLAPIGRIPRPVGADPANPRQPRAARRRARLRDRRAAPRPPLRAPPRRRRPAAGGGGRRPPARAGRGARALLRLPAAGAAADPRRLLRPWAGSRAGRRLRLGQVNGRQTCRRPPRPAGRRHLPRRGADRADRPRPPRRLHRLRRPGDPHLRRQRAREPDALGRHPPRGVGARGADRRRAPRRRAGAARRPTTPASPRAAPTSPAASASMEFARALTRRPSFLVLDEASAARSTWSPRRT